MSKKRSLLLAAMVCMASAASAQTLLTEDMVREAIDHPGQVIDLDAELVDARRRETSDFKWYTLEFGEVNLASKKKPQRVTYENTLVQEGLGEKWRGLSSDAALAHGRYVLFRKDMTQVARKHRESGDTQTSNLLLQEAFLKRPLSRPGRYAAGYVAYSYKPRPEGQSLVIDKLRITPQDLDSGAVELMLNQLIHTFNTNSQTTTVRVKPQSVKVRLGKKDPGSEADQRKARRQTRKNALDLLEKMGFGLEENKSRERVYVLELVAESAAETSSASAEVAAGGNEEPTGSVEPAEATEDPAAEDPLAWLKAVPVAQSSTRADNAALLEDLNRLAGRTAFGGSNRGLVGSLFDWGRDQVESRTSSTPWGGLVSIGLDFVEDKANDIWENYKQGKGNYPPVDASRAKAALHSARLCEAVYEDGKDVEGHTNLLKNPEFMSRFPAALRSYLMGQKEGLLEDIITGFKATLYYDHEGGTVHLVFAGLETDWKDPSTYGDWYAQIFNMAGGNITINGQKIGGIPKAYLEALHVTTELRKLFKDNLQIHGHSLGGGMAQLAGAVNKLPTHCFNAASLNGKSRDIIQGVLGDTWEQQCREWITIINLDGDLLTEYVENPVIELLPNKLVGTVYELPVKDSNWNPAQRHTMEAIILSLKKVAGIE